jgi:hypothetical protein
LYKQYEERTMLQTWWKTVRFAAITVGAALSFFAVIEVIRAYETLYGLHPAAGYAFLGILGACLSGFAAYFIVHVVSRPAVLIPPTIGDPGNVTEHELYRYGRYLVRYLGRLSGNPALPAEDHDRAQAAIVRLRATLNDGPDLQGLRAAIREAEREISDSFLAKLDAEVNREIRGCVRDVMAGVIFSPYKATDLLIVLYRNFRMVMRVVHVYNSRPRLREQVRIIADTLSVVAAVNYINMGKSLLESLGSHVPGVGRAIDDIAQGIGAGFLTSIVGHAALQRCRAFKNWDKVEAENNLRSNAVNFYADVRDMFQKDFLPGILRRLGDASKDTFEKIGSALDATGEAVLGFVRVPLASAGNGVLTAGTTGARALGLRVRLFSKINTRRIKRWLRSRRPSRPAETGPAEPKIG